MADNVKLSSLRVTADMDSSGYVSGAAAVTSASQTMSASVTAAGAAVTTTQTKVNASGNGISRLERQYVEGAAGAQQLQKVLGTLQRGFDTGTTSMAQAEAILGGFYEKYGLLASTAGLAAAGQTELATVAGAVNSRFAAAGVANDNLTGKYRLNAMQAAELGHVTRSLVGSLSAGIPVERAVGFELNRIASILTIGEGGLAGSVSALADGFMSLLTPVNLAIAAFAALAIGAGIWLATEHDKTVVGTTSLEDHKKWLDQILEGYDAAKSAADKYLQSAQKLPEGATESDLVARQQQAQQQLGQQLQALRQQEDQYGQAISQLQSIQSTVPSLPTDGKSVGPLQQRINQFQQVQAIISQIGNASSLSQSEIDGMYTSLVQIANTTADAQMKDIAQAALDLMTNARNARIEADSLGVSLSNLPDDIHIGIQLAIDKTKIVDDAQKAMRDAIPDLRNQFTRDRDNLLAAYNRAIGAAPTYSAALGLTDEYNKGLATIAAAQKAAEAKKGAHSGGHRDTFGDLLGSGQNDLSTVNAEIAALGKSAQQTDYLTQKQKLLNAAERDHIQLSPGQLTAIDNQAQAYAVAKAQLESLTDLYNTGKQVTEDFFSTLKQDLMNGTSLWGAFSDAASKVFDDLANKALTAASDGIWNLLWGAASPASSTAGGGVLGGLGSWIGGLFGHAAGGLISGPGTGTSDSIFARVSNGEFVMNAAATRVHLPTLEAMNAGRFAAGGLVGAPANSYWPAASNTTGGSLRLELVTTVDKNGNLESYVRSVSGQVAGQTVAPVAKAVGKLSQSARFG